MGKPLSIDLRSRRVAVVAGACPAVAQQSRSVLCRIEAFSSVNLAAVAAQKNIGLIELADLLRTEHEASFAASTVWRCPGRHGMISEKRRTPQSRIARRRSPAPGLVRHPA